MHSIKYRLRYMKVNIINKCQYFVDTQLWRIQKLTNCVYKYIIYRIDYQIKIIPEHSIQKIYVLLKVGIYVIRALQLEDY